MKRIRNIFLIFLLILLALPLVFFCWEKDSVSSIDNRKLTELDFRASDKTDMLDAYVKDRIGFRSRSIECFTELNDCIFGEMVHPTYTYGKDGYVFFKLKAEEVDTEFLDAFCSYIRRVQDYCEERDVPFLYCINPSKTTVYNRYLPRGYTYKNDFIEELYKSLEKYDVHYISNVELLTEKSFSEQVYNVKYDAGHWNDLGCFYGTNHLLQELSKDFPKIRQHTREDFTVSEKLETTLPVSQFRISETVPYFENKTEKQVESLTEEFSSIKLDDNYHTFGVYKNHNQGSSDLPKVLFFHGSYYNSHVRFYDTSFQESYQIHNYQNFIDFDYYFNLFKPDCVILESAEYATTRGYFDIEGLKGKKLNPVFSSVENREHDTKKLSELSYKTDTQGTLMSISMKLEQEYDYGYLTAGGEEYDLQISGTEATCTIQDGWLDMEAPDSIQVQLFTGN